MADNVGEYFRDRDGHLERAVEGYRENGRSVNYMKYM